MLSSDRMINIQKVIDLTKKYFGRDVSAFYVTPSDNGEDFYIECLVYRSFLVSFTLGDIPKGGIFHASIATGGKMFSLQLLTSDDVNPPIAFTEESINNNLDILNDCLIWRMTDSQKRSFNI